MTEKNKKTVDMSKKDLDLETYRIIFKNCPVIIFLINTSVEVVLTNYFQINKGAPISEKNILGNVLGCKNGCDAGVCGTHESCRFCMIRASIVKSFTTGEDFNEFETKMTVYTNHGMSSEIFIALSGTLVRVGDEQMMMLTARDITVYKEIQSRFLCAEYQRNYLLYRTGVAKNVIKTVEESDSIKGDLQTLLKYDGNDIAEYLKQYIDDNLVDSQDMLYGIQLVCRDEKTFMLLREILGEKYRIYRSKSMEEDISYFLNKNISLIVITPDVGFQEAGSLADSLHSINTNVPIIRLINDGDSIAGNYTKLISGPLTSVGILDAVRDSLIHNDLVGFSSLPQKSWA